MHKAKPQNFDEKMIEIFFKSAGQGNLVLYGQQRMQHEVNVV